MFREWPVRETRLRHLANPGNVFAQMPSLPPRLGSRVLLVDDNDDARELLARLLSAYDYHVATASDASDALALAEQFQPQIAVLDIGLPDLNGWELARRLRGISGLEQILLVALTGRSTDRDREKSRDAGIDEHLLKPIEIELLMKSFARSSRA